MQDIWYTIFDFLDLDDIWTCSLLNKYMYSITNEPFFLKKHMKKYSNIMQCCVKNLSEMCSFKRSLEEISNNFRLKMDYIMLLSLEQIITAEESSIDNGICCITQCTARMPKDLSPLSNLKILHLNFGNFNGPKLPESLVVLTLLGVKTLPKNICDLLNLKVLNISGYFKELPKDIGNLKNLRRLNISGDMKFLPSSVCKLHELKSLIVKDGRNLRFLPFSIGNLCHLEFLEVNNSELVEIPKSIHKMKKLQNLIFTNNKISSISLELFSLHELRYVRLGNNKITSIPEEISEMEKLYSIYLNDNQIEEIPISMSSMRNLHELHLRNNKIKSVPEEFANTPIEMIIDVCNNPLVVEPIHYNQKILY